MAHPRQSSSPRPGAASWLRRRLRGGERPAPSPADVALARLAYAERYRTSKSSSLYCGVVATVVRSYIEDRFGLAVRDITTDEFFLQLRRDAPACLREDPRALERVLACCEIARADRYELSDQELQSAHDAAVAIVELTRSGTSQGRESEGRARRA